MGEGLQNRDVAWTSPPPRVDKPRVSGIDLFRGALVVLVILGHFAELSQRHHFLTWFGIGFRMPLFIGLTGYLFNLELARSLSSAGLLRKYYDRMVLPWLAACAVAVVITGSIAWFSPFYAVIRPPYHLWFVPVILAFMFAAKLCRLGPATMLAIAIPMSIGSMYVFGVGHDVWQFGAWTPDRRYFIYPIYFTLGMWVARRPAPTREYPLLLVAFVGLLWWSRLYDHPSTPAEAAAELLLCVPLIALFPWLRRITFDIPLISAIGRDSLFFYLWHPLVFALWSAWGFSGAPLLALAAGTTLATWVAIARLPNLSGVLGVRPVASPAPAAAIGMPDAASPEGAV
jgi:fucose 4-O-acetylase-like acetyltransferase